MKNKELISNLQKLDPEATVLINIMQYNKSWGKQVPLEKGMNKTGGDSCATQTYLGCTINILLPGKSIISNWPKK